MEQKEISIEDWGFDKDNFWIDYYEENDEKRFQCNAGILEKYVTDEDLLEWRSVKQKHDGEIEEIEGRWDFETWSKERLTSHIVKRFLISQIRKTNNT